MAQAKDQYGQGITRDAGVRPSGLSASSRISNFSPFRRAAQPTNGQAAGLLQTAPSSSSSSSALGVKARGLGDISEVPSISKAPTPVKPPKPVGLRVKKAKALSISLLTGGGNSDPPRAARDQFGAGKESSSADFGWTAAPAPSRLSRIPSGFGGGEQRQSMAMGGTSPINRRPFTPNDSAQGQPARPQTAMEHYKEYGPSVGLASRDWNGLQDGANRGYSKKKKLSDWDSGRREERDESDELFIIGKGDEVPKQQVFPPSPRFDRSREAAAPRSDPQSFFATDDTDAIKLQRSLHGVEARCQSSLGIASHTLETSKLQLQSASGATATPFLNTYTARAHMGSSDGVAVKKRPTPLGKATIVRSSYRSDLGTAPISAPGALSSPEQNSPASLRNSHSRTMSSTATSPQASSIPQPTTAPRIRTQSHSGLSPVKSPSPRLTPVAQAASPLPPPRHKYSKTGVSDSFLRVPGNRYDDDHLHPRSSSPFGQSSALQSLGQQLGGVGLAVGKGWDMMRNWNSGPSSPLSPVAPRSSSSSKTANEATRIWMTWPDPTASTPSRGAFGPTHATNAGGVFGSPLREAVLRTRLATKKAKAGSSGAQLSALDLGSEFSIDLPNLESVFSDAIPQSQGRAVSRAEARKQYLPAVVVRCVEAIEKWGVEEEGIYRLSGRSSHTAKLKVIFDTPRPSADLQLVDIGPAELDLNSVCSLLKAYLRALPDLLITSALASEFNKTVQDVCGMSAVGEVTNINHNRERVIREQHEKEADAAAPASPGVLSQRIASAIKPLMSRLPAANWYMLREIAWHLGDLTSEEAVRQTKMPLSNLCLVLAPTLSLSVAMVRVLVESKEQLFDETCPLPDAELDRTVSRQPSHLPTRIPDASHHIPSPRVDVRSATPNHLGVRIDGDDAESKRASVVTVKPVVDAAEKRRSTSSVATLQDRSWNGVGSEYPTSRIVASSRPTSDVFGLGGYVGSASPSPVPFYPQDEGEEDVEGAPPIAAHFIRKRSSSIANSIGSNLSSNFSSTIPTQIPRTPSSASLYSNALQSSAMDSSVPSLADGHDSPRSVEDGWSAPHSVAPCLALSTSSGSINSLQNKLSTGALDRPRPTTSNAPRFFSNRSAGVGKAAKVRQSFDTLGAKQGGQHRRGDAASGLGSDFTPSRPAQSDQDAALGPPSRLPVRPRGHTVDAAMTNTSGVDEAPIYVDQVRRMWQSNHGH